jgi:hypothetical protein
MLIQLRMHIATVAFVASATAAAAETATTVAPSGSAQSSQTAFWTTRKLHNFGVPAVPADYQGGRVVSCDELVGELRFYLLQLGASKRLAHRRGRLPERFDTY